MQKTIIPKARPIPSLLEFVCPSDSSLVSVTSSSEASDVEGSKSSSEDERDNPTANDDSCDDSCSRMSADCEPMKSSSSANQSSRFRTFDCDHPGCVKRFARFSNLVNHHARGDHLFIQEKVRLRDKAVELFKDGIERTQSHKIQSIHNFTIIHNASDPGSCTEDSGNDDAINSEQDTLQQGWALQEPSLNARFSPDQVKFLTEKYTEGEMNGSKWDPNAVFEVRQICAIPSPIMFRPLGDAKQRGRPR
jgi:hypothetical protein